MTGRTITAVVFDIDGTLLTTGGAGGRAWGLAFQELYDVPASIEDHTEAGMPDHDVVRLTFLSVIGREPAERELATLTERYLHYLPETVAESKRYRVLPGVSKTLERLSTTGYLLGLTTGNIEAAAHLKLNRGGLSRYFSFGGYGSDSPDRGELTRTAIERAGSCSAAGSNRGRSSSSAIRRENRGSARRRCRLGRCRERPVLGGRASRDRRRVRTALARSVVPGTGGSEGLMPIATPAQYVEMIDTAKAARLRLPCRERELLRDPQRRAAWLCRSRLGRDRAGLDRRRRVRVGQLGQGHGARREGAGRLRPRGR